MFEELCGEGFQPGAPDLTLFYVEDIRGGPLMTPDEVLALQRTPRYVLYE